MYIVKNVFFKKISVKNFLSVGEEPVVVDFKPGLHIITGTNRDKQDRRNGVGKSTIADAIHFAVFGSTMRELKKENIVNNLIGKGCEVVLDFSVNDSEKTTDYRIVRMLEPSKCYLYINGNDETRDTINNTTEFVCKLLNTSQEVFQNCVIMTVNNTVPFMGKKKLEKRKFIEGIFNLEVFSKMLNELRSEHNEVKKDFEVKTGRHEEVENAVNTHVSSKNKFITAQKEKREKYLKRQDDNSEELKVLKDKSFNTNEDEIKTIKASIQQVEDNIDSCDAKLTVIDKGITEHETEIKFKAQTLSKIGTDEETCPVCLKPMSEHDREKIDSEIGNIKTEIVNIKKKIEDSQRNLETVKLLKDKLRQSKYSQTETLNEHVLKIAQNEQDVSRIKQLEEWNTTLVQDIEQIKNETDQFDTAIQEAEARLDSLKNDIEGVKHRLGILDVVKFIVSEEGVKSYIVRKILQVFNHKLAYYLKKMDANCICMFNEYFEEEIIDEKGKICSYFNFSGAERKNIDLACLFAFMDIRRLQGNVAYNFSVYDELLDSSLDESGVDLVVSLLKERVDKYNECIMVISHRKESSKIASHYKNPGEVIYLEKSKGITRRVEFTE